MSGPTYILYRETSQGRTRHSPTILAMRDSYGEYVFVARGANDAMRTLISELDWVDNDE